MDVARNNLLRIRGDDHDWFDGDVATKWSLGAGGDGFNFIDHVHTFNDLTEYCITSVAGEVQHIVIHHVDKKLGCGAVGVAGASHRDSATVVFEAIVTLVDDAFTRFFFDDVFTFKFEATALDHEAIDDAMK